VSGYGGLSLSIEGPSKADIECQDNEDGSCRVTYRPTEPGNYVVNVKFADEHVPGMITNHPALSLSLSLSFPVGGGSPPQSVPGSSRGVADRL